MLKTRVRVTSCVLWLVFTVLGFYSPNPASAETYTATATERDFYFTVSEPTMLTLRTYAQQNGIDSMLWLYDDQNNVVIANDDHFGLDSYINYQMQANVTYRLRAGVCCGDPERWYGTSYTIDPNLEPAIVSTTTVPPTTTTTTLPLPENANWSMVNENDTLELAAPNGFVFSEVLFASYGTPNGQNGRWTIGNCHAQNSVSIVEQYVIGQSYASVPANNSVFGDPCGGTPKRLAVTALYAPAPTTTTTSSTTTTTTSTTVAPTTTTTVVVFPTYVAPSTSTTSSTTTTYVPTTTVASTTVPPVSSTAPSTTTVPAVPETTTTSLVPETFPSTTTIAPSQTIAQGIDASEALAIVTTAAALQELTASEADKVFEAVEVSELSDQQAEALVEAVQDAPEEVRAAFEDQINVFEGKFDKYVPLGSVINVGQRKVLIAATGVLFMAPTVSVSSSTSGSQSNSRRKN